MTIKTFDAFSRLSFNDINRIAHFLYTYSGEFRDTKRAIKKSILYATKEISGLGGYVFVIEGNNEILGAIVINRTGMNEYIPENILVYIAVKEDKRGKGLGETLLKHAKFYCKGDIAIHINVNNQAISLFEKHGFKKNNLEMRLTR
ncbi:GNAT family N-acetyltransferase [Neotamlana laminarinivorans]|uniref:GNAT family N-acetyltransferase n=1 Tax=Neotamlana laminarinivorans TaxID=2883124 RepID=A0A9X1I181_9FLAO|nr:GNAT family N-acetyltransferase [Tamlana laminarinivorans]MCB4799939.1 GNAT family N-acetyltransferase [Tamlana laminarinivorans]